MRIKTFILAALSSVSLMLASCGSPGRSSEATKSSPAHSHSYSDKWNYDKTYHWHDSTCGHKDEVSDKGMHTFVERVVAPTYESDGYTVHTCSVCGYSYQDKKTDKLTHHYSSEWSSDGEVHYHACTDAGYTHLRADETAHSFVAEVVAPTYESGGYTAHTCTVCGYSYNDTETDELPHHFSSEWSHDANAHYRACTDEGYEDIRADETAHTFNDVVTEPTYGSKGYTTHTCTVCGYSFTDSETDKVAHNYATEWSHDEEAHYRACTDVGYEDLKGDEAAHSFGDWIVDEDATMTEDGLRHRVCSVCGYSEEEVIDATGTSEKLSFSLASDDKSYYVGPLSPCKGDVIIPAKHNGLPVTAIYDGAFYGCDSITSISIPDSVTYIGGNAFADCTSLASIAIPDSITSIDYSLFYGCSSLTSISIPRSVTEIGTYAFKDCSSLASIVIPDGVTNIGESCFSGCSSLASITIPSSVASFGEYAFINCPSLTFMRIPEGVTSIGRGAFSDCSSLISVTLPSTVTEIGNYAFNGCNKLIEVVNKSALEITAGSTSNGYVAYYAMEVTSVEDESKVGIADDFITYNDGTDIWLVGYLGDETSIVIPSNVTKIYKEAFSQNSRITSVVIPNNVTTIGENAFFNCGYLISLTIGSGITNILGGAFTNCYRLVEIINKSALKIVAGEYNFGQVAVYAKQVITNEADSKLSKDNNGFITYNDGTDIWLVAYVGGESEITIPGNVTKINQYAFADTELTSVAIPNGVVYVGSHSFYKCSRLDSIVFPESVTFIGYRAFMFCGSLTSAIIPSGIVTLGNEAFDSCSSLVYNEYDNGRYLGNETNPYLVLAKANNDHITSCQINENCKIIGSNAFKYCDIASIVIPDSVGTIGYYAFGHCPSLVSVTIGSGVTALQDSAFYYCSSLPSIDIPASVTEFGYYTFQGCSALATINFGGTKAQWNAISKEYGWKSGVPATSVHCSDGDTNL